MKLLILIFLITPLWASEELFDQYCATCHTKERISFKQMKTEKERLIAPPINLVIERLKEVIVITLDDDDVKKAVITAFIKDYVQQPNIDKGVCRISCFERFGVMPSQKGRVDPLILEQIASWAYENY